MTPVPRSAALRIVVLATTFPRAPGDGTPDFVLTLAAELARLGAEVTVVTPSLPGAERHEWFGPVEVCRFRYFPRRWEDLAHGAIVPNLRALPSRWAQVPFLVVAMALASRRAVRAKQADVVHAHWIVPAALVARFTTVPYVVTVHGADAYTLQAAPLRWIKRLALRRAAAVVPVSGPIAEQITTLGVTPHAPIPMGVDAGSIRRAIGDRQPIRDRVLFVGRLAAKKGVDDLLTALSLVEHATLRIVGDGPERESLERLAAELGVAERVCFLGTRSRVDVLEEMASAAIVALPSKKAGDGDEDGVPMVLAEAIAGEVPVIATSAGGIGSFVDDGTTGWLVPPGAPDLLAEALRTALADPEEAQDRARRGRRVIGRRLSIDEVGPRYLELLREAAHR